MVRSTARDDMAGFGYRRSLLLSTAIVALVYAGAGMRSVQAQTVIGTGDVVAGPSPWTVGYLEIGDSGLGTLTIEDGGQVHSTDDVFVGGAPGGDGTVTITGSDGGSASTWNAEETIFIGYQGIGAVVVEEGGHLSSHAVQVGEYDGSEGSVRVSGSGSTWDTNGGTMWLGGGGEATLLIESGGVVTSNDAVFGAASGGTGKVTVTGDQSKWNTGYLYVGYEGGTGTLDILDGGLVDDVQGNAYVYLGYRDGAVGTATVSGVGSTWNVGNTLVVGEGAGSAATGTLTIDNAGTVHAGRVVIGRNTWGTGTLELKGTAGQGIIETGYVAKGDGTATLTLDGGILRAARNESNFLRDLGPVAVGAGGAWFDTNSHDIGISTVFTGATSFHKQGLGTLTLSGDSSGFIGTTTVSAGTLLVGNGLGNGRLGGSFEVLTGAVLGGGGTVGSGAGSRVTVQSGGALSPGNSIGTLHVDGDLELAAGSRFVVEVNPLGLDGDLVTVTGEATLLGGSVAHVGASGAYDLRSRYTILSADELTGAFDGVTSNFAFLTPELIYDYGLNTVDLGFVRNDVELVSAALTPNQLATAGGIDSIGIAAGHPVYDAIALLPADLDLVRASFDALSGEIHASAKGALIDDSVQIRDAMNQRLRAGLQTIGASATPVLVYGPGGPELAPAAGPDLAAWGGAFGSWGHLEGDGNAASVEAVTGGLLLGADTMVGDWRVGLMAGYGQSGFELAARASAGSSDNHTLGLYGGTEWGNVAFRSGLAYSWHDIETSRSAALLGETLRGSYGAGTVQGFGELGYRVDMAAASFEPFANLAYVRLSADGYGETGGAAALSSASQSSEATFTTLGLRASSDLALGTTLATARAMVGWRHAFGDVAPTATHAFAGSDPFTVTGAALARDAVILEAGVDLNLAPNASLGLAYAGQHAGSAQAHGVKAQLAVKF